MGGGLWSRLAQVFAPGDAAARAAAERILLEADFGPATAAELLDVVDREPAGERHAALERAVTRLLVGGGGAASELPEPGRLATAPTPPTVILIFGVNGVGKTTSVAKLARRLQAEGRRVLLAAADTFRAGAVEQLQVWAERLGAPWVGPAPGGGGGGGADPAAVAFDALQAARARGYDTVVVDTAGRLHTEQRLLQELSKVARVVGRQHPGAPHESLLVVEATVGQAAVQQAQRFAAAVPLTGLIVTKLDGTARGGSVVALRRAVPVPIRFLGTGEGLDDLAVFDATQYARRLLRA